MDYGETPIRVAQIMGKMNSGGVESFVMNYYKNINRTKIQFDFFVDQDSVLPQKEEIEKYGGRIFILPPYQHIFKYVIELTKILKKNKYNIIHSHLNTLSVFPLFAAWIAGVPNRIAHSHSTSNKKEKIKDFIKSFLKPLSKIFSTDYFACSEHAGRWLFGNKLFEAGKVIVIKNAINIERFKYNEKVRSEVRKKINLDDKFIVGHVGRFMKQKNHNFIIDVFYEVYHKRKDAVLLLIGDGPLEDKIKEKVNKLKLQDVVYFLGVKNNVNDYMQAMDCFIFPSLYEGLGIVLIEAQYSGLQCLVSNEVPEEVKVNDNIKFLSLNSTKEWCNLISSMEINRKGIAQLEMNEYDIKFEKNKLEEKYIELFNRRENIERS